MVGEGEGTRGTTQGSDGKRWSEMEGQISLTCGNRRWLNFISIHGSLLTPQK